MPYQYPEETNNILVSSIHGDILHFVEDALGAGFAEKNLITGEALWSPRFFELLGYTKNEIYASTENFIEYLLHPDDKAMFLNAVDNLHQTAKFKKVEVRLKTKQGKYKWFENANMIERDESGKPCRVIGTIIPIDGKKNLQLQLEKSETLLSETAAIAKIAGLSYNVITKEHIWSKELYNIYEVSEDYKPSTETNRQFYCAETQTFIWNTINNSIANNISFDIETEIITGKGNKKWIRAIGKPATNENGEVIFVHAVLQDITELKKKELELEGYRSKLEKSERILQETNHLARMVSLEYDMLSKKLYWCREYYNLYEVPNDYVPGLRKDLIFYKEEYRTALLNHINDTEQFDKPYNLEAELITAKGNHKWVKIIGEPVKNESDEVIRRKISIQDITDTKKKQLELQESSKIIADRNGRLTNFAHIVSHNMRAHTSNIRSLVELIKNETNEEIKQELFILLQNVSDAISETLEDLSEIAYKQTETGNVKSNVSFEQVFDSVIKILSADIFKTETLIEVDFSNCPYVEYVPAYLESIMLNLISNSIKYKHPERHALIEIETTREHGRPVLKVSDNGMGIDMKRCGNKIFNLYQTFHNHPNAKGIGLYITRNQIESMGGSIEVESIEGEGATFKIIF